MKAAKNVREEWEEANLLRLIQLAEIANERINSIWRWLVIAVSVALYLAYRAGKSLLLILKLIFLSEPSLQRIERDESWIFRQIK